MAREYPWLVPIIDASAHPTRRVLGVSWIQAPPPPVMPRLPKRLIREVPEAVILKLADRIANVEASAKDNPTMFAKYWREYPTFYARLSDLKIDDPVVTRMWARLTALIGERP